MQCLTPYYVFFCFIIHINRRIAWMYSAILITSFLFFCSIGSLPPSNSTFDIIVDPRRIVDGGSSFGDVSSACIIDSVLENFKSLHSIFLTIICSKICQSSSARIGSKFALLKLLLFLSDAIFPFSVIFKIELPDGLYLVI